ncbi:hypothetical protein BKA01_006950 [Pseudonocardia eucalypti]|nr:hypothetical protein [Pseudonocardia eucalypti]
MARRKQDSVSETTTDKPSTKPAAAADEGR